MEKKFEIFLPYKYKYILLLLTFLCYIIFTILSNIRDLNCKNKNINITRDETSKFIDDNFFVIDSNNLEGIKSHMYGFCISKKGILTNNYYKKKGFYEEPESQGVYIMVKKIGNKINLYQDYYGNFGLYFYENKNMNYFALSNSLYFLEEYLIGKQNFSLNQDFSDNFISSALFTHSIRETMIKEIIKLPSSVYIILDIQKKKLKFNYINNLENFIPFDSKKGLKIIDNWADKWGFILRSLNKKTNNIAFDLTGGFDTRAVLSVLIKSGIQKNQMKIKSINDKISNHEQDYKIAKNISLYYGLKLNNSTYDGNYTTLSSNDSLSCIYYTKLGFHKGFNVPNRFFVKPRFSFTGGGGELIRGYPGLPIKKYLEHILSESGEIMNQTKKFYSSSKRLLERSLNLVMKGKKYNNDYDISSALWQKGGNTIHFGKASLIGFLTNKYSFQILMDPDLKKLKFDTEKNSSQDLLAYIYIRFSPDLINFPFERNRILNKESIKKAEKLNKKIPPYKIKLDYNKNFYIDNERNYTSFSGDNNAKDFVMSLFKSSKFTRIINEVYNNEVYDWAIQYSKKQILFPFKHLFGLLSVYKTLEDISLNRKNPRATPPI